jgi:sugar transferase (PEP-CTERM/EpsH1 system associated)
LKTLYLSQRVPYPPNKGEKIRTFHQIEYLLRKGHEITLACPHSEVSELPLFQDFSKQYKIQIKTRKLGASYARYLSGLVQNKPLSVSNFYSPDLQMEIDLLISEGRFQNIVCTSSSMAEYIFRSKSLPECDQKPKLIMDFMDLDSDKWSQYSQSSKPLMKWVYQRESRLLSKFEQKVHQHFDACFFISQAEIDLFCKAVQCDNPPLAIGNGIDSDTFSPAEHPPDNKSPVFIFTGVMDYKPNIDAALWFAQKIWPQVIEKYPGARFIIAGMNPSQHIIALKRVQGIEITGFVDDIMPYYHQSDCFVAPLRIARGVQNKVLQAFSCGLPVISTSMGAEGIDCTEGKDILIADSPEAFLSKIENLFTNKLLYASIKKNALELVHTHYTWDAELETLARILQ